GPRPYSGCVPDTPRGPRAVSWLSPSALDNDWERAHAVPDRLHVRGDVEVGEPLQQLLESHAHLAAAEVRTEATVHPHPEGEVGVVHAVDIDGVGVGEDGLVAVPRPKQEQHALARLQPPAPNLD